MMVTRTSQQTFARSMITAHVTLVRIHAQTTHGVIVSAGRIVRKALGLYASSKL